MVLLAKAFQRSYLLLLLLSAVGVPRRRKNLLLLLLLDERILSVYFESTVCGFELPPQEIGLFCFWFGLDGAVASCLGCLPL